MAAAENKAAEITFEPGIDKDSPELGNEAITNDLGLHNSLESNTPVMNVVSEQVHQMSTPDDQNGSVKVQITKTVEQRDNNLEGAVSLDRLNVSDEQTNNTLDKYYPKTQSALRLTHNNLSSSLNEGIERTGMLLSVDHSHGLSSLSLEVMTSGEQLNLLAEGLGSSQEGSLNNSEDNFLEDEEVQKSRESCASASDAAGCVDIEDQCECLSHF